MNRKAGVDWVQKVPLRPCFIKVIWLLFRSQGVHTMCVCVTACYFIVNVLDLPFVNMYINQC